MKRILILAMSAAPMALLNAQAASNPAPCRRPPARAHAVGSTITIASTPTYPCRVEFRETGVVLRADSAGRVANLAPTVARDSRGRFYTYTGFGEITVWNPNGTFLRSIGREGQGPGEFARSGMTIHADAANNLYVRDNNMRWSVLSPDYALVRTASASGIGFGTGFVHPIGESLLLTGEVLGGSGLAYFNVYDLTGRGTPVADGSDPGMRNMGGGPTPTIVKSFGTVPANELTPSASERQRRITPPVGNAFWAGPPEAVGRGYELQKWSLDGTLQRTIRRDAPWYKVGDDVAARPSREGGPRPRPPTAVVTLQDLGNGLLFIAVRVTNDQWAAVEAITDITQRSMARARAFDVYYEVIDTDAGVVLAAAGPIPTERARQEMNTGWFGTGTAGYRSAETADGFPSIRMMELRLLSR